MCYISFIALERGSDREKNNSKSIIDLWDPRNN